MSQSKTVCPLCNRKPGTPHTVLPGTFWRNPCPRSGVNQQRLAAWAEKAGRPVVAWMSAILVTIPGKGVVARQVLGTYVKEKHGPLHPGSPGRQAANTIMHRIRKALNHAQQETQKGSGI